MAYALTSQKRGGYIRKVVAVFDTADEALEELAMRCPEERMDTFIPGDALLPLRDKTLRVEILNKDDIARGWTLRFPRQMCNYKLKKEGKL